MSAHKAVQSFTDADTNACRAGSAFINWLLGADVPYSTNHGLSNSGLLTCSHYSDSKILRGRPVSSLDQLSVSPEL